MLNSTENNTLCGIQHINNTVLIWPQMNLGQCCVFVWLNKTKIVKRSNKQYKTTAFAYSSSTVPPFWFFKLRVGEAHLTFWVRGAFQLIFLTGISEIPTSHYKWSISSISPTAPPAAGSSGKQYCGRRRPCVNYKDSIIQCGFLFQCSHIKSYTPYISIFFVLLMGTWGL